MKRQMAKKMVFLGGPRQVGKTTLARVLARLHTVEPAEIGLAEFGRPGNYYERQIGRWSKQYVASKTEQILGCDKAAAAFASRRRRFLRSARRCSSSDGIFSAT